MPAGAGGPLSTAAAPVLAPAAHFHLHSRVPRCLFLFRNPEKVTPGRRFKSAGIYLREN